MYGTEMTHEEVLHYRHMRNKIYNRYWYAFNNYWYVTYVNLDHILRSEEMDIIKFVELKEFVVILKTIPSPFAYMIVNNKHLSGY